ncbi:gliding motility-associated C-terminal domain-containing protein [Mucilaginibacter sp. CAU 1740]|uniref:gliding motility-associated C-terminal domain-containing protein n=1 Tax=Mucilaginibacter sp. CAU 1740 TaxID=3140365 RepID=UPI00325A757F
MYLRFPFLSLLMFLVLLNISVAKAQQCEGSYGDPVVKLDFGSGTSTTGPPLESGITEYVYVPNCADDGQYSIVSSQISCHDTWHVVTHDHTGNPGGYMMLVNASFLPKAFFTQTKNLDLCENTKYEFSAYVLNLLKLSASVGGTVQPDLLFTIKKQDGTILKQYDTGTIPPTADPEWVKYSMPFSTLPGVTSIILEITNNGPGGNGNDLLLDDIEFRACGPAIPVGFGSVGNNQPQPACASDPQIYHLVANPGAGYDNPKYQWQTSSDMGATWTNLTGPQATTPQYDLNFSADAGTYQYRLAVAEGDNINSPNCRTYSGVLTINVDAYPVVPQIDPAPACIGESFTLNASGGASYEWFGPGVTPDKKHGASLTIDNVTFADAGDYHVDVKSTNGCTTPSNNIHITVSAKPVAAITGPSTVCSGTSVTLQASPTDAKTYSWLPVEGVSDPTSPNPIFSPAQTTTYTLTVTNNGGCIDSKQITLEVIPSPTVSIGAVKKIFEGKSVVLDAEAHDADLYLWTPSTGLDDPTKKNPVASPTDDITYTVKAMSDNGCEPAFASVFVRVFKKITIPTVITPNGDGKNDTWNIEALETYPECELKVFNRNGQTVFSSKGYSKPWNGGYNGYVLPSGTYYYTLDLKDGEPVRSGWVYLAR